MSLRVASSCPVRSFTSPEFLLSNLNRRSLASLWRNLNMRPHGDVFSSHEQFHSINFLWLVIALVSLWKLEKIYLHVMTVVGSSRWICKLIDASLQLTRYYFNLNFPVSDAWIVTKLNWSCWVKDDDEECNTLKMHTIFHVKFYHHQLLLSAGLIKMCW